MRDKPIRFASPACPDKGTVLPSCLERGATHGLWTAPAAALAACLASGHDQGTRGDAVRGVVALSREVVDVAAVAAAGARLRDCSAHVPRPATGVTRAPATTGLSVWATVDRFDAVWGDGLAAVRAELGLLASALQRASWARQDVERVNARLLAHAASPAEEASP